MPLSPYQEHIGVGQIFQETDNVVFHELFFVFVIFQVVEGNIRRVLDGRKRAAGKRKGFVSHENPIPVLAEKFFQFGKSAFSRPFAAEQRIVSSLGKFSGIPR